MIVFAHWNKRERARERAASLDRILAEVTSWPGVAMAPHQFDAVEFQLDGTEFGHLHRDGRLDVPFVRRMRNALVDDRDADAHPWVPDSGWVTFQVRSGNDAEHAIYLLRLSYLYRTLVARRTDDDDTAVDRVRAGLAAAAPPKRVLDVFDDLIESTEAAIQQEA